MVMKKKPEKVLREPLMKASAKERTSGSPPSSGKHKPAVLQVEMHPHATQQNLLKYCNLNEIKVTAYSSFGGGSWIELGMAKDVDCCYNDDVVKKIAEKLGKTG